MAIKQSVLIGKSVSFQKSILYGLRISASDRKIKTAFLCHSHKDELIVKGLIVLFKEAGINLYIDWEDHAMPAIPNGETARKIQTKIRNCELFLFLATQNAKSSRWCPWEIGYADSSNRGIYIISTADSSETYGNEYLELYPSIDQNSIGAYQELHLFKAGSKDGQLLTESILV
mgnify:CR=1 FL=1